MKHSLATFVSGRAWRVGDRIWTVIARRTTPGGPPTGHHARCGFTLVEATIASAIVGMLLVAAMHAAGASGVAQFKCSERTTARMLADGLIMEIFPLSYEDPDGQIAIGRESGEVSSSKVNYDDVDDFDNWTESPPQDKDGVVLPGMDGWSRRVVVEWAVPYDLASTSLTESDVKRIRVIVRHNNAVVATRVIFRTRSPEPSSKKGTTASTTGGALGSVNASGAAAARST